VDAKKLGGGRKARIKLKIYIAQWKIILKK